MMKLQEHLINIKLLPLLEFQQGKRQAEIFLNEKCSVYRNYLMTLSPIQ